MKQWSHETKIIPRNLMPGNSAGEGLASHKENLLPRKQILQLLQIVRLACRMKVKTYLSNDGQ